MSNQPALRVGTPAAYQPNASVKDRANDFGVEFGVLAEFDGKPAILHCNNRSDAERYAKALNGRIVERRWVGA